MIRKTCSIGKRAKSKKILFIPIEVGIAHIARSLALAEKKLQDGHNVYFALPKRKQAIYSTSPVKFIDIPGLLEEDSMKMLSHFKDINKIRKYVADEMKLINAVNPDEIYVDFRISALVTAAVCKLPTYVITGSSGVPYGGYFPNIGLPNFLHKTILPLLNKIIWHSKSKFISVLEKVAKEYDSTITIADLIDRPTYIIAETPEYLPYDRPQMKIEYAGPLHWKGFGIKSPDWISNIQPNGKTVYLSFGGTGFDKKKLIGIATELIQKGCVVVVSASSIAKLNEFPQTKNLYVAAYLPGLEISKRVDVVVCHGGYGTLMQALEAGKPTVSVPFNPDQLIHALRFAELGLGKIIMKPSLSALLRIIRGDWTAFEKLGKNVSVANITSMVEEVLKTKNKYLKAIQRHKNMAKTV